MSVHDIARFIQLFFDNEVPQPLMAWSPIEKLWPNHDFHQMANSTSSSFTGNCLAICVATPRCSWRSKAADLSRTLNEAGAVDFLNVLDAERSLYSAESVSIQSRANIAVYFIALNKALDGGWDGGIDASRPAVIDVNIGPHLARTKPQSNGT